MRFPIPANRHDFPGFPVRLNRMQTSRQEWQIVQSQFDLRDLLPGFVLHLLCRAGKARRRASSGATGPRSNAERGPDNSICKVHMTLCKLWFTARRGEAERPARMHRRANAGGILSTGLGGWGCSGSVCAPNRGARRGRFAPLGRLSHPDM